ncbi:MAG: sulfonate transport system permease protein [Myxococcales bacterium]|nr:sulfonate transport system permease protein [Myxococcales bacterium]
MARSNEAAPDFRSARAAWSRALMPSVAVVCALLLWQVLTLVTRSIFFPSPREVAKAAVHLTLEGDTQGRGLLLHAAASLLRVLKGFVFATLFAVPTGIVFGLWRRVYDALKGLIEPIRFIPPLGWVPLAIIFLRGENRYTFIIALGTFFPILISTMTGVESMDFRLVEVAQVLGASRWQVITKIVWPATLPSIVTGARLGMGVGWACIVAAEMIGGESTGLGRMIVNYGELLQIDAVVVGMLAIGILGYLLNELFLLLERKLFPWRRTARV